MSGSSRPCIVLLVGLVASGGCSLERFQHDPCSSHVECRADFGFGAVCGASGLCQRPMVPARCSPSFPDDLFADREQHRPAIVLGSLVDSSSEAEVVRGRAVRLAVKQASASGGVDGRSFALVECDLLQDARFDRQSRTAAAASSARFLTETLGVSAVIGSSAVTGATSVWLEPDVSLSRPALHWRTSPSDSRQARLIAEDLRRREVTDVVVLRESAARSEALVALFSEQFSRGPARVEILPLPSEEAIDAAVASLPDGGDRPAEVLFVASQPSWVIRFLQRAAAAPGFARRAVFLTDVAASPSVLAGASAAAALFPRVRGTRAAGVDPLQPVFSRFVSDYQSEYGGQSPVAAAFSAHAYDAAWLTLYGAAWSLSREGSVSGPGIARGLARLRGGPSLPVGPTSFDRILLSLRGDAAVEVSGASGELDIDPQTRELDAPLEIWTIAPTMPGALPSIVAEGMTDP